MAKTTPIILFGQNALRMRTDVTITVNEGGEQLLAPASNLENENSKKPFLTFEPNQWLLDGSYMFLSDTSRAGYISFEQSDGDGQFSSPPKLQFDFGSEYSTEGLTLYFQSVTGDWADDIDIAFYDSGLSLIRTDNYNPSSAIFNTGQVVADFQRIIITINHTNKPNRFARLVNIEFDKTIRWQGDGIKNAKVAEEINYLGLELPFNTANFTLFSAEDGFSITNPSDFYSSLQYKEPLDIYEDVNGEIIYMGRFYLDTWDSKSENLANFTAVDILGIMSTISYNGDWFNGNAVSYIEDFLNKLNVEYEINAYWNTFSLTGLIPVCKAREALQNFCFSLSSSSSFAVGVRAVITTARSHKINITSMLIADAITEYDYILTKNDISNSKLTLLPLITRSEVPGFRWRSSNPSVNDTTILNDSIAAGTYLIYINDAPAYDYTVDSGSATISESGANHIVLVVSSTSTIVVTAKKRIQSWSIFGEDATGLPANIQPNVIKIGEVGLIGFNIAVSLAKLVLRYYQQRYKLNCRLYASKAKVGNTVLVDVQGGRQLKGIIEKSEIDLAGGFISDVEIVGVLV